MEWKPGCLSYEYVGWAFCRCLLRGIAGKIDRRGIFVMAAQQMIRIEDDDDDDEQEREVAREEGRGGRDW